MRNRLLAGLVEPALRFQGTESMTTLGDGKHDPLVGVVWSITRTDGLATQEVVFHPQQVALLHQAPPFGLERQARKADEEHNNAQVDDIATVTPRVAHGEVVYGFQEVLPGAPLAGSRPFVKFTQGASGHKSAQVETYPGVEMADTCKEQQRAHYRRDG